MVDHRRKLEIFWRRQEAWQLNKIPWIIVLSSERRSTINSSVRLRCLNILRPFHVRLLSKLLFYSPLFFYFSVLFSLSLSFDHSLRLVFLRDFIRVPSLRNAKRVRLTSEPEGQGIYTAAHAVTLTVPASFSSSFKAIIEQTKDFCGVLGHRWFATLTDSFAMRPWQTPHAVTLSFIASGWSFPSRLFPVLTDCTIPTVRIMTFGGFCEL